MSIWNLLAVPEGTMRQKPWTRYDACRNSMPRIANRDWCRAIHGVLISRHPAAGGMPLRAFRRPRPMGERRLAMKQIGVGIIGTGWCGGIRAQTCAASPLVRSLHLAEIRPERLAEVARATDARTAVADYRELLDIAAIEAVYIAATPEKIGRAHL